MKRRLTWLAGWLCAALALGLVFWLRPDGEKKEGVLVEGNGPQVTKPYPREREERGTREKNPREEFEAARKRGLTEDEVRGIVEDFLELGIDSDDITPRSLEGYYQLRIKRQQWLLNALVAGFALSDEQKKQAAATLQDLGEKEYKEIEGYIADSMTMEIEGKVIHLFDGLMLKMLAAPDQWLEGDLYLPWNLCELDQEQKELVGLRIEGEGWIWPRPGSATVDFGTNEKYENLDDPFTRQNDFIPVSGKIFPLSMEQVDRIRAANSFHSDKYNIIVTGRMGNLTYVKLLTAPQLMTLLLLRPDMAGDLLKELGE